jgi:toxin ParE1/3/4
MKRGHYRLTALARADLLEIWDYVASESGFPARADRLVLKLRAACQAASEFPRMGRPEPQYAPGLRIWREGAYLIAYLTDPNDDIDVLRILHGARDIAFLLAPQDQPPETGSF